MATEAPKDIPTPEPAAESSSAGAPHDVGVPPSTETMQSAGSTGPEAEDAPPQKPPRPASPNTQNINTLREAFPTIEPNVIRAVLLASRGELEPAFHALLSMSDPSSVEEQAPPPPPRPQAQPPPARHPGAEGSLPAEFLTSTPQSQLDADAIYARQLQQEMGGVGQPARRGHPRDGRRRQRQHARDSDDDDYYYDSDKDHSFFDDDLPAITENIKKGFAETQTKFTNWFADVKKKLDGNDEIPVSTSDRTSGQYSRSGGRNPTGFAGHEPAAGRASRDREYDADPQVLGDDFAHLELHDNTEGPAQRRPKANPNLFQPSPTKSPVGGRKVSFDDRPTTINNDDDLYRPGNTPVRAGSQTPPVRQSSPATTSKWEPLKSVDPTPMDRDPFSLGDSDDEKDVPPRQGESAKAISVTGPQESGVTSKTG